MMHDRQSFALSGNLQWLNQPGSTLLAWEVCRVCPRSNGEINSVNVLIVAPSRHLLLLPSISLIDSLHTTYICKSTNLLIMATEPPPYELWFEKVLARVEASGDSLLWAGCVLSTSGYGMLHVPTGQPKPNRKSNTVPDCTRSGLCVHSASPTSSLIMKRSIFATTNCV